MGNVSQWYARVTKLPSFLKAFGAVKIAAKPIKPANLLVKEKPKAAAPKEAPKPAAKPKKADDGDEEEKPKDKTKNPLDLLPETKFDLYNFKTLFVNHPDKANGGVDELIKQFDKEGWSMWFLQYEKYKGEGEVMYKTENLLQGFLQRFEKFNKYSFARMCVTGEEPNLEIEGVFMWRGLTVPQECIDHPQFEYYKKRTLSFDNAEDVQIIREFWGGAVGKVANGRPIQSISWHK